MRAYLVTYELREPMSGYLEPMSTVVKARSIDAARKYVRSTLRISAELTVTPF